MFRLLLWTLAFLFTLAFTPALSTAATLHVSKDGNGSDPSTWAGAFQTIGAAVNAAHSGDEIWIKQGRYEESVLLSKNLSLLGGFSGKEVERDIAKFKTTISGASANLPAIMCPSNCFIQGLILRDCNRASMTIYADGSAPKVSTVVHDCTLTNNTSPTVGGGILISHGEVDCSRCVFTQNNATGYSQGGALYIEEHSTVVLNGCVVSENSANFGGGIVCLDSMMTLNNCRIQNNHAWEEQGAMYVGGVAHFTNCLFQGNTAPYGSVLRAALATFDFVNCTIIATQSSIGWADNGPQFHNCILWGSPDALFHWNGDPGTEAEITHTAIQGGYPGEGNISDDPKFRDPANKDFHLLPDSPCIDSATLTDLVNDLDGNPRPVDIPGVGHSGETSFDMGCYEFQLAPIPTPTMNPRSDVDRNGRVDADDLMMLLEDWKKVSGP
jgi:hypothetical protein